MITKAPRTDYIELVPERDRRLIYPHATDKDKLVLKGATNGPFKIRTNDGVVWLDEDMTITSADLDTGSIEAGKDYNLYACYDDGYLDIKTSLASTYPAGYDADSSILAGGFHTLCMDVGTISGHLLSGYEAGDVTPTSVWDLRHRAKNLDNRGLAYHPKLGLWIQIYESSDNGAGGVQSVNGATILDTLGALNFIKRGQSVGMRLLTRDEFYRASLGSNQQTNIAGSDDPVTAGGSLDTAGRAMINHYGHWRLCGSLWTWVSDEYFKMKGATSHTHTENTAESYTQNATTGNPSVDVSPAFGGFDDLAGEGSEYIQTESNVGLVAGGAWGGGAGCGSRAKSAVYLQSDSIAFIGARFCVEPL